MASVALRIWGKSPTGDAQVRKVFELQGTTSTVTLLDVYKAAQAFFKLWPAEQVLRLADDSKDPVQPGEVSLPSFTELKDTEKWPSLAELGISSGQQLFLLKADPDPAAASPSDLFKHFSKNTFCKFVAAGKTCKFGKDCRFAHSLSQMRLCPTWLNEGKCSEKDCPLLHSVKITGSGGDAGGSPTEKVALFQHPGSWSGCGGNPKGTPHCAGSGNCSGDCKDCGASTHWTCCASTEEDSEHCGPGVTKEQAVANAKIASAAAGSNATELPSYHQVGRQTEAEAAAEEPQGEPTQLSEEDLLKRLWKEVEDQKKTLSTAFKERQEKDVEKVLNDPETLRLKRLLGWTHRSLKSFAEFRADLDRTVGLQPVKDFISQRLWDAAGKAVLKEERQLDRHILISGAFGVGKRTAAIFISRLYVLLGSSERSASGGQLKVGAKVRVKKSVTSPKYAFGSVTHASVGIVESIDSDGDCRIKFPEHSSWKGRVSEMEVVEGGAPAAGSDMPNFLETIATIKDLQDPRTKRLDVSPETCYFCRLTAPLADDESAILDEVLARNSIMILAAEQDVADAALRLPTFLRKQPDRIPLTTLGVGDIARMVAAEVEKRSYAGVGEGDVGTTQLVTVLEHIVRQRFDDQLIRLRNGYLAKDMLSMAIARKNDRTKKDSLYSKERFRLTPSDFGLDVLTSEQRDRRLEQANQRLDELVGWGSADKPGTPRHFFDMVFNIYKQAAASAGAPAESAVALQLPRAVWVSANPGTGRETFVKLAAMFLRACGAISKEECVVVDAANISSSQDFLSTSLANAGHGCLAVLNLDQIAEDPGALKTLAATFSGAEGVGCGLVILIGSPDGMQRIARLEPSLPQRFPTRVSIADFTATELVHLIQKAAASLPSGKLVFEDGLNQKLIKHIQNTYGEREGVDELMDTGNRGLALQLLQTACQNRIARHFASIQDGTESPGEHPDSNSLTAADFEIGAALGESVQLKEAIDQEVEQLIGMASAKEWFKQIRQKVSFVEQTGTKSDLRVCLNVIITGNPGTGKTTFARLLARFFHTYGILPKDTFVEKNGLELKAEHMGGTAPRVKAAISEAMGGCLFLDEAYALIDSSASIGGGGDAFSQEALRTLLTEVENNRTGLMVVLAGYKEKMGKLMRAEEGLARRFPQRLHLDDYTPAELAEICEKKAEKHERFFEAGLREKLATHIQNFYWRDIAQQNAGLAVNLTEQALDRQIVRLVSKYPQAFSTIRPQQELSRARSSSAPPQPQPLLRERSVGFIQAVKKEVATFTAADFGIEERPRLGDPELRKKVQEQVERLTGMSTVKDFFKELERTVAFVERGGDPQVLQTSLNLQLTGNPGTGKTTVARLIGRYLYAHGILPRDIFVERNALALKGQFVGQTAPTVMEAVRDAMGGCLFIDEAYSLVDKGGDRFSGEVIRTLLTEVENHRTGLLVVLAGYTDKMEELMDSDPGLRRRFATVLCLPDYTPEELALICENAAADRFQLKFKPGLRPALAKHIQEHHGHEIRLHNGGLAVTLVERAFRRLAQRLGDTQAEAAITGHTAQELIPEDFCIGAAPKLKRVDVAPAAPFHPQPRAAHAAPNGAAFPTGIFTPETIGAMAALFKAMEAAMTSSRADAPEDDADGSGVGPAPAPDQRQVRIQTLQKSKVTEVPKEEPRVAPKEGEKVLDDVDIQDVLNEIGLCPASFEWIEMARTESSSNACDICHNPVGSGFRCAGGSHYVCWSCIDFYKSTMRR